MNYNSGQVEVTDRFERGLTFNSTYIFAKSLADNQGPVPDHFADENAGHRTMDLYDRKAEYGPVWGTRKHRWITTAVYELPFGKGGNSCPIPTGWWTGFWAAGGSVISS